MTSPSCLKYGNSQVQQITYQEPSVAEPRPQLEKVFGSGFRQEDIFFSLFFLIEIWKKLSI